MKTIKYYFSILLSMVCVLLPIVGLFSVYYELSYNFYILLSTILIAICTFKPLKYFRQICREQSEYDEFGRSKKKGIYSNLSRAERDLIDLQKTADMERILDTSMVKKITKKGSEHPKEDMNHLVGLDNVKQKILEMSARMKFDSENQRKKKHNDQILSSRHMVFYGNPGTGKTTVARILTGFLYQYHYIKKNKCIEVDGNFLKAGADTAIKTKLVIQEAYDGVLFIDEAYALYHSIEGNEAIATLIKEMEDHRDRFILIMAGYPKEMNDLLDSNPGFKSRIKEYISFEDYSVLEMCQIFSMMAKEYGFLVSEEANKKLQKRLQYEQTLPSFSNGRTVRNLLDEILDKHAYHFETGIIPKTYKFTIHSQDVYEKP